MLSLKYTVDNELFTAKHSLENDLHYVKSIKIKIQKFLFNVRS